MPEINQSLIDDTWRRIRAYDNTTAVAAAQRFAREQPAVLHFTREFLREFDEETQGTALGLVYLLFQAAQTSRSLPLPSLSPEQIEERYTISSAWLEALDRHEFVSFAQWQDHLPRSPVALYIIQAYVPASPQQGADERRRRAHLFILLMTLLDALGEPERGQESR